MDLPEDDLTGLAKTLDAGKIEALHDRFRQPRQIRQELARYTPRIFLFPFDTHPDVKIPVQVFINGIMAWMGEEVVLVKVGKIHPRTVVVIDRPLREKERVQATYVALPAVNRT